MHYCIVFASTFAVRLVVSPFIGCLESPMMDLPECEQVLKRPCKRIHGKAALYSKCSEAIYRLLIHKFCTIGDEDRLLVDTIHHEHKLILAYYAPITIQLVYTRNSYCILIADRRCEAIKHVSYQMLVQKMENLRNAYERYFGLKYHEVRNAALVEPKVQRASMEKQETPLVWAFGNSFVTDGADFYYRVQRTCLQEAKEGSECKTEADKKRGCIGKVTIERVSPHINQSVLGILNERVSKTRRKRLSYKRKVKSNQSPEKKDIVKASAEMSQQSDKTSQSEICKSTREEKTADLREMAEETQESSKKKESSTFSMFFDGSPSKWNSHHSDEGLASRDQVSITENCASSPGYFSSSAAGQDAIMETPTGTKRRSPYSRVWNYRMTGSRRGATNSHVYAVLKRRSVWGNAKKSAEGAHAGPVYGGNCEETALEDKVRGSYSGSSSPMRYSQEVEASPFYTRPTDTRVFPENTQCTKRNTETVSAKQGTNAGALQSFFHRGSGYPVTSSYQVHGTRPKLKPEAGDVNAEPRKLSATQPQDVNDEKLSHHSDIPLSSSSAHAVCSSHILHLSRPIVRQKQVPNARSVQAAMPELLLLKKSAIAVGKTAEHSMIMPSEKMSQAVGNEEEVESQAGMPDIF